MAAAYFPSWKFKPNTFEGKFKPVATFPRFFTSLTWVVCIRRSLAQVEEAFNWSRSAFGSNFKLFNNSAVIFLVVKGQSWWWCSFWERRRNNYSLSCCWSSNQSKLSRLSAITRDAETYLDINIILMICLFFLIIATMIVMTMLFWQFEVKWWWEGGRCVKTREDFYCNTLPSTSLFYTLLRCFCSTYHHHRHYHHLSPLILLFITSLFSSLSTKNVS